MDTGCEWMELQKESLYGPTILHVEVEKAFLFIISLVSFIKVIIIIMVIIMEVYGYGYEFIWRV